MAGYGTHMGEYSQPLSLTVSCGNSSYNTNSPNPSASVVTAMYIVQLLFECGNYLNEASIRRNTVILDSDEGGVFEEIR